MPDVITVLIADDHPVVREGIAAMLSRRPDMDVIAEVGDGQQAIDAYTELHPDVVLMDLRMPTVSGVEAIRAIRASDEAARVIVLTTFDGDEDIYRALQAGAMAYLLKGTPREELLETVRAVAAGERRIPPEVAAKLAERMTIPDITPREAEVLRLIAEGMTNRAIGQALSITEGTVKAHVNNILTKLNANDRTQAVTIALQRGIIQL
jgi:two-component system NarL family response regulator